IKEQYVTKGMATKKGLTVTGIVVERDNDKVVLKDATGKLVRVAVADIEEEGDGKSLMPEGVTKFLTHDELLDLIRFVSELGKPGPYAVQTAATIQRWRVLRQFPASLAEGYSPEAFQIVLAAKPHAWEPAYSMVSGVLPLDELK